MIEDNKSKRAASCCPSGPPDPEKFQSFCRQFNIRPNPEQARAIQTIKGPLLLISVPGSGKTTVMVSRLGWMILEMGIPHDSMITVTFSVEAANSMRERFVRLFGTNVEDRIPEFRTIHSLSMDIVKTYCCIKGRKPFKILEDSEPTVREILKSHGASQLREKTVKDTMVALTKASNLMMSDEEIADLSFGSVDMKTVHKEYKQIKQSRKLMDFDDIMIYALRILKKDPEVLEYYRSRFRYFSVDEAQDNSKIQNEIMQLLAEKSGNLFMVGDEDQSIYGFRGAYPQSFFEFIEKYGDDKVIKMETNYRSCDRILRVSEAFISRNKQRYPKKLIGIKGREGKVRIKGFSYGRDRDIYISEDCLNYNNCAVLARNNDSLIATAYALMKNRVDFNIRESGTDLFSTVALRDTVVLLRMAGLMKKNCIWKADSESESAELKALIRKLNLPNHMKSVVCDPGILAYISGLRPKEAVRYIMNEAGLYRYYLARCEDGFSVVGFNTKLNILESIADMETDLCEFVKNLEVLTDIFRTGRDGAEVSLLTCHGSKGLEFEKVYLIDIIDGVFPACEDPFINADEYEEETRLFYVGLTRAMEEAEILTVRRPYWGEGQESDFLVEIRSILAGDAFVKN